MPHYLALISVPALAEGDEEAEDRAADYAETLRIASGRIGGHGELAHRGPGGVDGPVRLVHEAEGFQAQIPMMVL